MRPTELAYLAGIVDGEGSLEARIRTRAHGTPSMTLRLVIGQVDRRLIDWIAERVPGQVHEQTKGRHRTIYLFRTGQTVAVALLRELLPYLIVKREQAELFIALAETSITRGRGRVAPWDERQAIAGEITRLKHARP